MNNHDSIQHTTQTKTNNTKIFAEMTANTIFPKREQAIVLNTINEIRQIEYVKAFSKIIRPKNITYASWISNNRFYIYFTDKCIVDELAQNYSYIEIKEHQIPFRRLVNPAKRYIIFNAYPIIPHDIIYENLLLEGIKTISPITFLKAGFQDELVHISSFRRQVYIHPEDISKVPGSILITYENTEFRIFLTDDMLTCYLCKQTRHTPNYCKKELKNTNANSHNTKETIIEKNAPLNDQDSTQDIIQIEANSNTTENYNSNPNNLSLPEIHTATPNKQIKRPPPSSSCPSSPTFL